MPGLEVVGGISAIISIIDASIKVWDGARKDLKLSNTFETVASRLPILQDILRTCRDNLESVEHELPQDAAQALQNTIENCKSKAEKLEAIFKETIPGDDDQWYQRYRKVVRRLGKGSKVEELLSGITSDAQNLVNYHTVKSASPELHNKLQDIIEEAASLETSLPTDETTFQTFKNYDGTQNVSTGSSTQHNNTNLGSGTMNNFASIAGNPVFNLGTVAPIQADFHGEYAYSSLRPVETYIHRPKLEQEIQACLMGSEDRKEDSQTRTVIIWGLGGAGKSQLVLDYIRACRRHYKAVFWVQAGSKQMIERDYVQIYRLLSQCPTGQNMVFSPEDAITAVKSWLQAQEKRCLWVMDSADQVEDDTNELYVDLNHYLPEAPQLDRIVTTRSSSLQESGTQRAIATAEMGMDEAVQLFQKCAAITHISEDNTIHVKDIVAQLGFLALAVTLAGSYVSKTPRIRANLSLYLQEYHTNRKRLLGRKAHPRVHQYSDSVLSTWETSFIAVEQQYPIAARLLTFFSFIHFDNIYPSIFEVSESSPSSSSPNSDAGDVMRWLRLLKTDEASVDNYSIGESLAVLQAYSLVSWREGRDVYAMHELVHAWGYERLPKDQQWEWSLAALELLCFLSFAEDDCTTAVRLMPHIVANTMTLLSAYRPDCNISERSLNDIMEISMILHFLGQWNDMERLCIFHRKLAERAFGVEHPQTLESISILAVSLQKQGKHPQARDLFQKVLELRIKVLGAEHPDTLVSMNNVALELSAQRKFEQAETLFWQTLELEKRILGPGDIWTLMCMNNLAFVLREQKKHKQELEILQEAEELIKRFPESEDQSTVVIRNNLAFALAREGTHEQAEELYRYTLKIARQELHPGHPNVLSIMYNLAGAIRKQGRYDEAEEMYRQMLEQDNKKLEGENPAALLAMITVGGMLFKQDKYVQAEEILREALKLAKNKLGPEHYHALLAMSNVVVVLKVQGKHEEAEELYQQMLELREKMSEYGNLDITYLNEYMDKVSDMMRPKEGEAAKCPNMPGND